MPNTIIQPYAYDRNEEFCQLFETVFGKPMGRTESVRHFHWEYLGNSAGRAVIHVALNDEDRIISAYPVLPVKMKVNNETVPAGLSFDSMTHPQCKGQGLFTKLGKATYAYLENNGYALSYGFPNRNIHHLRVTQFGWFELCKFPLLLKILNFTPFAARVLQWPLISNIAGALLNACASVFRFGQKPKQTDWTVEEVDGFDDEFDHFWRQARNNFSICVERNSQYLRWRYACPEESYSILKICGQSTMAGYAVLKTDDRFHMRTGFVMDFITLPKQDAAMRLIAAIEEKFRTSGVDVISVLQLKGNPCYSWFKKAGFISVPRMLHPQEIHFSARVNIEGPNSSGIRDCRNWMISWGDTDLL